VGVFDHFRGLNRPSAFRQSQPANLPGMASHSRSTTQHHKADARCTLGRTKKGAMYHSADSVPARVTAGPTTQPQLEPLLSPAQVGEMLGLQSKTVQKLARYGELPAVRIGRYWRFRASDLNKWIDVQSSTPISTCVNSKGEKQNVHAA
jgi:excisionase family DNA binding protein